MAFRPMMATAMLKVTFLRFCTHFLLLKRPLGVFSGEVREIHGSPGKILVTKENASGQEGIPSSPMLTLAVFENRGRSFAKCSRWVKQR